MEARNRMRFIVSLKLRTNVDELGDKLLNELGVFDPSQALIEGLKKRIQLFVLEPL